jgi:signal transduction histidine kinase
MAYLLLHSETTEWNRNGIMLGFIGLGVADMLHAITRPGEAFVLLHNIAVLTGGIGFALSWLNPFAHSLRWKRRSAIATHIVVAALGLSLLLLAPILPPMLKNGSFTLLASTMNIVAGLLFLAAAWLFFTIYHRLGNQEVLGFAIVAVLLGVSGLTFGISEIWSATWWYWHFLRLSAYFVVFGLLIHAYRQAEIQKDRQREDLKGAYAELIASREELRRSASDLARSNQELEQFAYSVSHDLREPLRTISSFLTLIRKRYRCQLDAKGEEFIDYAVGGADRLGQMIQDLLQYSRIQRQELTFQPVPLFDIWLDAVENLYFLIEETGARITHDPLPVVQGENSQLNRLLQNLMANAITYCKDGKPQIHIGVASQGDQWLISVQDNGIGIKPEHWERIFQIFQRLHTEKEYPGTGIGLATCKKIVERHGGQIWVESEPGKGSIFFFTLPKP